MAGHSQLLYTSFLWSAGYHVTVVILSLIPAASCLCSWVFSKMWNGVLEWVFDGTHFKKQFWGYMYIEITCQLIDYKLSVQQKLRTTQQILFFSKILFWCSCISLGENVQRIEWLSLRNILNRISVALGCLKPTFESSG